jgi:hypothetical protein
VIATSGSLVGRFCEVQLAAPFAPLVAVGGDGGANDTVAEEPELPVGALYRALELKLCANTPQPDISQRQNVRAIDKRRYLRATDNAPSAWIAVPRYQAKWLGAIKIRRLCDRFRSIMEAEPPSPRKAIR